MNEYSKLGENIQKIRVSNNLTQEQVAQILGISTSAVSQFEYSGKIKIEHLYLLCKLFNISFEEIINQDDIVNNSVEYWKSNYNLNNFDLPEISNNITNLEIDKYSIYFKSCKTVYDEFYRLLPKWAFEQLNVKEKEIFSFLKSFFSFDINYYAYTIYGPHYLAFVDEKIEKEFINSILNKKNLKKEELKWELEKCFYLNIKLYETEIFNSNNMQLLSSLLDIYTQPQKDFLLMNNLQHEIEKEIFTGFNTSKTKENIDYTYDEIEKTPFFKVLINSGCQILKSFKLKVNKIDEDDFSLIEGNVVIINLDESEKFDNIYLYSDFAGKKYYEKSGFWKCLDYNTYQRLIDKKETKYIKSLVNDKEKNPLKYFKELKEKYEKFD